MQIHLDPSDGVPIYVQIINQVKYLVASGRLLPGEELPPIRVLAERLVINPNTVARAYRELERAGVVTKRSTTGTFVAPQTAAASRQECVEALTGRVDVLLAEANQMGVGLGDLCELLCERHRLLHARAGEKHS
jgi:GntR family transcriptional regulator